MKKTQLLDACRNIRKELVAWLSIIIIGLLATVSYLGITYSAATLKKDALRFFNSNGLWDIELSSTLLLDGEDLEAVRALPGVAGAEPVWTIDARLRSGGSDTNVALISRPDTISLPTRVQGRLPAAADECAVEKALADSLGLRIGQRISPEARAVSGIEPLREKDFVITGIFQTPDHITSMVASTPYILVQADSFNLEGLGGAFMKIRLRVEDAPEDRYSDAYLDAVKPVEDALSAMAAERAPLRREKLRAANEAQLDEAQRQLDEALEKIRQGRVELDSGWRQVEEASEKLGAGKDQLDSGQTALRDAEEQIRHYAEIIRGLKEKGVDWAEENIGPDDLPPFLPIDYAAFLELLHSTPDEAIDWLVELAETQLKRYGAELEAARLLWYGSGEEYLDALTRYEQGLRQLREGEEELARAQAQWDEADRRVREGRALLDAIGEGRWVVLDNRSNGGFLYAEANASKLSSLSMSFSMIFLVVGALVIYATIGRMVEQHRSLIGATKAMGLYNREVFAKYLFFACSAVLLGVGLGILIACFPLQRTILDSYEKLLNYGTGTRSFLPLETGLVVAGAFAISVVAVYLGCGHLLRLPAIQLMQNAVNGGTQKSARRSARRSLFYRLVFRNMRTDWSRVLVTIISIAGGCALMTVGFTLRYGISGVPGRQFGGILRYEAEVFFDAGEHPDAAARIEELLDRYGLPHIPVSKTDSIFEVDESLSNATLIAAEKGSMDGYFALASLDGGETLELPDSGALVPRRFWEYYGIGPGGSVAVYNSDLSLNLLKVAGVFENYYGQLFFLTPQSYEEAFGTAPTPNCFFVKTEGMPLDTLREALSGVQGLVKVSDACAERTMIEQFTASLNLVVWLMLFIAGMMACFIVANFTLTYIQRKTRELTIMRINGFSTRECVRYSALDLVVTTILGTLLGLLVGSFLGRAILSTTETPYIQMIREPAVQTYLYAALITCGFSVFTNGFALRRIKRLKLSDLA
ncbi:MAG: hypothetical protein K6F56_00100 [Oscillospiraceae bacterium]|nr:hypothetical protein [Oscillospiraceae bacterium]